MCSSHFSFVSPLTHLGGLFRTETNRISLLGHVFVRSVKVFERGEGEEESTKERIGESGDVES